MDTIFFPPSPLCGKLVLCRNTVQCDLGFQGVNVMAETGNARGTAEAYGRMFSCADAPEYVESALNLRNHR